MPRGRYVDTPPGAAYETAQDHGLKHGRASLPAKWIGVMKVRNSLKSLRSRHRNNRLVRRKGRVYVINKTQKRFKARQG